MGTAARHQSGARAGWSFCAGSRETAPGSIVAGGMARAGVRSVDRPAAVAEALAAAGFDDIGVRRDFADVERFVIGRRP